MPCLFDDFISDKLNKLYTLRISFKNKIKQNKKYIYIYRIKYL